LRRIVGKFDLLLKFFDVNIYPHLLQTKNFAGWINPETGGEICDFCKSKRGVFAENLRKNFYMSKYVFSSIHFIFLLKNLSLSFPGESQRRRRRISWKPCW